MPIPSLRELRQVNSVQEIFDLYINKYFWHRVLEFLWINYDPKRKLWTKTRYSCDASKLTTCGCHDARKLVVKYPTGIFSTCVTCAKNTSGPITFDDRAFTILGVSRISKVEAMKLLKDNNQISPVGADSRMNIQSRYEIFKRVSQ